MTKLSYVAVSCLAFAAGFLTYAATQPSYVDSQGFIVEPFAWEASGKLLLVGAMLVECIDIFRRFKRRSVSLSR